MIVSLFVALKARGVRVIHYSIQSDHLHLMVESSDGTALSRQMQLLFSRIAMRVNRIAHRRGALFRDRHHRHELRTPTETRRALVYILFNDRKHAAGRSWVVAWREGFSSAPWFTKWDPSAPPPDDGARPGGDVCPLSAPGTWLAQTGWLRAGGPLRFDEMPASSL